MAWSQVPDRTEVYDYSDTQYLVVEYYNDLIDIANYHYRYKNDDSVGDADTTDIREIKELTTGLKLVKVLSNQWFEQRKEVNNNQ